MKKVVHLRNGYSSADLEEWLLQHATPGGFAKDEACENSRKVEVEINVKEIE